MALQDHHLQRDRNGGLKPMHHHAERVTNQNHIAMRVDNASGMRVIRGKANNWLSSFARAYIRSGEPTDLFLD
jgi:hypothetical protein